MMQPIEVRRFEVRRFVGSTSRKPARALTKERKSCIIIFDALPFRARTSLLNDAGGPCWRYESRAGL
eukprot:1456995-Prymnesium_polylepis.1